MSQNFSDLCVINHLLGGIKTKLFGDQGKEESPNNGIRVS